MIKGALKLIALYIAIIIIGVVYNWMLGDTYIGLPIP